MRPTIPDAGRQWPPCRRGGQSSWHGLHRGWGRVHRDPRSLCGGSGNSGFLQNPGRARASSPRHHCSASSIFLPGRLGGVRACVRECARACRGVCAYRHICAPTHACPYLLAEAATSAEAAKDPAAEPSPSPLPFVWWHRCSVANVQDGLYRAGSEAAAPVAFISTRP